MGNAPPNVDWGKLLSKDSSKPIPDLEIVTENQQRDDVENQQRDDIDEISDQDLNERIRRIEIMPEGVLSKLKDKGAKLYASLNRLTDERERRKLLRPSEVGNFWGGRERRDLFLFFLMTLLRILRFLTWVLFVLWCVLIFFFFMTLMVVATYFVMFLLVELLLGEGG